MLDQMHALESARRLRFYRSLLASGLVVSVILLIVRSSEYHVTPRLLSLFYLSTDTVFTLVLLGLFYLVWRLDHTVAQQREDQRRLQTRYRAIVDTQQEMIWRCSPDGVVTFVNAALCRTFETTETALIGRTVAALLPSRPDHAAYLARLCQSPDHAGHRENLFSPPGGGPARWHQWCDRALLDDGGQPMEIQSTGYDITQRKAYEASLAQSEGRFTRVEQTARVGSYEIILPNGSAQWSRGVYAMLNVAGKPPTLTSDTPLDKLVQLIHPDDRERVAAAIEEAANVTADPADPRPYDQVVRALLPGQPLKHLRLVGQLKHSPFGGTLTGLMLDVTDFREAEETSRRFSDELQSLSRRLVEAQETERRRIARELHDEVGQQLTGLRLMLEMAGRTSSTGEGGATTAAVNSRFAEMAQTVTRVTTQVRELSQSLRPTMLDDLGLQPALCWLLERYTGQTGIQVDLRCSGLEGQRFDTSVETVAYRIVQEALTNIARYAGVTTAQVSVWAESDALQVQVTDGGAGFDPAEIAAQKRASGLSGMKERAMSVGGQLVIESAPGQGARLSARLPLG